MRLGAEVYGISSDSVETHAAWIEDEELPFHLLADCDGDVRQLYGIPRALVGIVPGRATFVITPDGTVREVHAKQFDFESHAHAAVEMVRRLAKRSE